MEGWRICRRFFLTDGSGAKAPQPTRLELAHDGTDFHALFRCVEPRAAEIRCQSKPGRPNWDDDRIELHIAPGGDTAHARRVYFSVNADGVYEYSNLDFSSKKNRPRIKSSRDADGWNIELTIPGAAFGDIGLAGRRWLISAGRFHRTSFRGTSALAPVKGHFNRESAAFIPFVFASGRPATLERTGELSSHGRDLPSNCAVFRLPKTFAGKVLTLNVISENARRTPVAMRREEAVKPDGSALFYYNLTGDPGEIVTFELTFGSAVLFRGGQRIDVLNPSFRTYRLKDPLFEPLLDREKKSVPRLHSAWDMPWQPDNFNFAMKYAYPYSGDLRLREMNDAGIHLFERVTGIHRSLPTTRRGNYYYEPENQRLAELFAKVRRGEALKPVIYSYYSLPGQSADGAVKGLTQHPNGYFGWIADPINQQAYLNSIGQLLEVHGKEIAAVTVGDEQFAQNYKRGLKMDVPHNRDNPTGMLKKIDRTVREKYGFGKYGIPWGMDAKLPEYPFARRAYITYLHDVCVAVNRKVRDTIKAFDPDLPLIADDCYGVPSVHGVQHWSEYADIGSFQLGEGGGAISHKIQEYAFRTKMVRDLSGLERIQVVPHECTSGYPTGAASSEEMLELYSQALRGGATSFHFWPDGSIWERSRPVFARASSENYPLAWGYVQEISKLVNKLPPLKFPSRADTAILVSDEALKCDDSRFAEFSGAFTMLGPSARTWFKFISDTTLEKGRDRLADYRIVYLPYARYVKRELLSRLENFVRNGGTLICADPQIFEFDISGASLLGERQALLGVRLSGKGGERCLVGNRELPVHGDSSGLVVISPDARITGCYENGGGAVAERKLGKGIIRIYAFSPFVPRHLEDSDWETFIKAEHVRLGGSIGHDIWRFKLPTPAITLPESPRGRCLTGNYAYWDRFAFQDGVLFNASQDGVCRIVRNGRTEISSLAGSRLTDRRTVFRRTGEYKLPAYGGWVESFEPETEVEIIFDFVNPVAFALARLFFHGMLPEMRCMSSDDGAKWTSVGEYIGSAQTAAEELSVREITLTGRGRYLKLSFRTAKAPLELAEIEVWEKSTAGDSQ